MGEDSLPNVAPAILEWSHCSDLLCFLKHEPASWWTSAVTSFPWPTSSSYPRAPQLDAVSFFAFFSCFYVWHVSYTLLLCWSTDFSPVTLNHLPLRLLQSMLALRMTVNLGLNSLPGPFGLRIGTAFPWLLCEPHIVLQPLGGGDF